MSLKVHEELNALDDDLFDAGFAEGLGGDPPDSTQVDAEKAEAERVAAEAAQADADKAAAEAERAEAERIATEAAKPAVPEVDINKLVADAVAAAVVPPVKETPATPAGPTPEEIAAEEQYRKDWPEHAAREDRLKAQLEEVKSLLSTTTAALKEQIAPVITQSQLSAEERHYNTIYTAHPDADTVAPALEKWISEQPKFLQPHYTKTLAEGTAADIVELFTTFKKTTGAVGTTADDAAAKAAAEAEAADKAARLKRMATPAGVRTSVTAEEDPDDFDSAFESTVKSFKKAA